MHLDQMLQLSLLVTRDDVRAVEMWEEYMNGMSRLQRVWHARDKPEQPDYEPAFFSKRSPADWSISAALLRAISLHLQTRAYNDQDMRARKEIPPDPNRLAAVDFIGWDAYTSSSDEGVQRYRCGRRMANERGTRDATWATVCISLNYILN